MTFTDLQNGLYNLIEAAVGLGPGSGLQLIQPAPPLPSGTTDAALWAYMNSVPPLSLTWNYVASPGNQFFSDYQALMSALVPSVSVDFQGDITTPVYNEWLAYIATLPSPPAATELPNLFLNWANATHPGIAAKGASDLSALILDPIHQGQLALMPYISIPGLVAGKPPEWALGYAQLTAQLARAPGKSLTYASLESNANVAHTWTAGAHTGFYGLWRGASTTAQQTLAFASQSVSASISCAHVTMFTPPPGPWYDSAAFGLAYSSSSGNPWNPNSAITWQTVFGPSGNLQRVPSSLVVASGIRLTISGTAQLSTSDQAVIRQNSAAGLWPFFSGPGGAFATTSNFTSSGALTISSVSLPNVPILLGIVVLTDSQYSSHATQGLKLFRQLSLVRRPV